METTSPSSTTSASPDEPRTLSDAVRGLLAPADESARRRFVARCLAHFSPDELCAHLKDESERALQRDAREAVALADALITVAAQAERADLRALGLMARGDALRAQGRFAESVATLDTAGQAFLAAGDEVGWARTRVGWLVASHHLGHGPTALDAIERASTVLVSNKQWLRAAILENNAGWVCGALGRYEQARIRYGRAEQFFAQLGEATEAQRAWVRANTAVVLRMLGDFQEALGLHEEVRQTWLRRGDAISVARQDHNIACVYEVQGHYTQALRRFDRVTPELERAGFEVEAAWNVLHMAQCYLGLNRTTTALELAEEAVRRFERCATPGEAAKARVWCALASARLGDSGRALAMLEESREVFSAAELASELAFVLLQQAALQIGQRAQAASSGAAAARELCLRLGLPVQLAQAELVLGRALLAGGDLVGARGAARAALVGAEERDLGWLAHQAQHMLGRVAEADGDLPGALARYDGAIVSIERAQRTLAIELRGDFLQDKQQVYDDAIVASLHLARPHAAFGYLERAKSRAVVDYLSNNLDVQLRASSDDRALLAKLARLREEHNWYYRRLDEQGPVQAGEPRPGEGDADRLRAAIREREKQIATAVERLALDRAEGLGPAACSPDAQIAPPQLEPGTVLVEYHFRPSGGTAFVVAEGSLTAVEISARPDEIRHLLQRWQINLASAARALATGTPLAGLASNARGILGALHRALLAPLAPRIELCARLVIIPYGVTHAVPFHALHDGARYLIERCEVAACPSSDLLRLCAERTSTAATARTLATALVLAHTADGRLPLALDEARAVAGLLPGELYLEEEATCAALVSRAPRHRVLHLAAHGEARLDNPAFAHLRLADGQLGTTDVFNLDLRGALVTLSACETGRAVVTGGDELVGLSRDFLYAGAATLVQSLWRVEDAATATLMIDFYRALRAGRSKGAALREAQLAALDSNGAHPYRWAPFQLVGDYGCL